MSSTGDTPVVHACPSPERLNEWLAGDDSLTLAELQHIDRCAACVERIEKLTDDPDLEAVKSPTRTIPDFQHEPEFLAVKRHLSQAVPAGRLAVEHTMRSDARVSSSRTNLDARTTEQLDFFQSQIPNSRYRLQRVLGCGGSGTVVLAYDRQLEADVAIKFLNRQEPVEQQRFNREAELLNGWVHPNVVQVFQFGTGDEARAEHLASEATGASASSDGRTFADRSDHLEPVDARAPQGRATRYLVMEYLSGGSAADLQPQLATDFPGLARMLIDAANGLQAAHERNLVHRDVKPSNLLYDVTRDTWKVADFGLVKAESCEFTLLTQTGDLLGTPAFMSPEQVSSGGSEPAAGVKGSNGASDSKISFRTDIYSLGATMYTLLTGQAPLQGGALSVLRQIPEVVPVRPRVINPRIPVDLETICLCAMEKSPADRYPSMEAFAEDLRRYLDGRPIVAKPVSPARKLLRWSNRNRAFTVVIATAILLFIALGLGGLITSSLLWRQQHRLVAEKQQKLRQLSRNIALADPGALSLAISQLEEEREAVVPYLESDRATATSSRAQVNFACALTSLGAGYERELIDYLNQAMVDPGQCLAMCRALSVRQEYSRELIRETLPKLESADLQQRLAIIAMQLGDIEPFHEIVSGEPDGRTSLIHLLPSWHGDLSQLIALLRNQLEPSTAAALVLGIGLIDPLEFSSKELDDLEQFTGGILAAGSTGSAFSQVPASGLAGAAAWLRRRLGFDDALVRRRQYDRQQFYQDPESLANDSIRGFRLVRIPAGTFVMGTDHPRVRYTGRVPHRVTLTRDFWLADREVSVALFRAFTEHQAMRNAGTQLESWEPHPVVSPTPGHPAQQVSWYEAVLFCNWLSEQHGMMPYYRQEDSVQLEAADGKEIEVENWVGNPAANGYRLPTEAEFEYACRAGTQTLYSFGDQMQFFDHYVAWSNNTTIPSAACGSLMPNPWGLFDMHGNVWEWCEDWYQPFNSPSPVKDPLCLAPDIQGRSFRGGGICTFTGYPESTSRGGAMPGNSFNNVGFRVARNSDES